MTRLKYEFFHIPKAIQCLTNLTLGEKAFVIGRIEKGPTGVLYN